MEHFAPASIDRLIVPDFKIINESKKTIAALIMAFQTDYLGSGREKSRLIKEFVSRIESKINPTLFQMQAKLENENTIKIINSVSNLEDLLSSSTLVEVERIKIQEQIIVLKKMAADNVSTIERDLEKSTYNLKEELGSLADINLFEDASNLSAEKHQELSKIVLQIKNLTSKKEGYQKEYTALVSSMDVMRKHNIFDMFMDMLPSDAQITALGNMAGSSSSGGFSPVGALTMPEVELVREGVAIYKKMLNNISAGFSYMNMQEVRLRIENQMDEVSTEITTERKRAREIEDQLADLKRMIDIHEAKTNYSHQFQQLALSFQTVLNELKIIDIEIEPDYNIVNSVFSKFLSYLQDTVRSMRK